MKRINSFSRTVFLILAFCLLAFIVPQKQVLSASAAVAPSRVISIDKINGGSNVSGSYILNSGTFNAQHWVAFSAQPYASGYKVTAVYPVGAKSVKASADSILVTVHEDHSSFAAAASVKAGYFFTLYNIDLNYNIVKNGGCITFAQTALIPASASSLNVTAADSFINGVSVNTDVNTLISNFTQPDSLLKATDNSGAVITSGILSTGCKISLTGDKAYTVVIKGDVNCDGALTVTDYITIRRNISGSYTLTGARKAAADIDGTNGVETNDYLKLKAYFKGAIKMLYDSNTEKLTKPVQTQTTWQDIIASYGEDKVMRIGAHGEPDLTLKDFQNAKDMGLTYIYILGEKQAICPEMFELAKQVGLKTIVSMGNNLSYVGGVDWSNDWSIYENNFAVNYFDEPSIQQFGDIASWVDKHNAKYNGGEAPLFWVNLLPFDCDGLMGKINGVNATDEEYVSTYCEQIMSKIAGTPILSYDFYPLRQWYEGGKFKYNYIDSKWLRTLELTAKYAKQYGADTHAYIQTSGYGNIDPVWGCWTARMCDEESLRLQVYTSMAFGIRSFSHFTYWTSPYVESNGYTKACVDTDGTLLPLYYQAKTINEELAKLDSVYLSYEWTGTKTFLGSGNSKNEAFDLLKNSLSSLKTVNKVSCSRDTVIGQFYDNERKLDALVISNYTETGSELTDNVTLTMADGIKSLIVYTKGEYKQYNVNSSNQVSLTLEPGQGVFAICMK